MNIALTGATGYIGGAVLDALIEGGTTVTAVVRSEAAADTARAKGAEPVVMDLTDRGALRRVLAQADGAVHAASPGDATSADVDSAVVDAVIEEFSGTAKPYVHTSGIWLWGSHPDITEDSPLDPPAIVAWRVEREDRLLDSSVAATVIAPGVVHGEGGGIANLLVDAPAVAGTDGLSLIGDGTQHWGLVHVRDLAALYVLALQTNPGGRVIGVSHTAAVGDLAAAAHPHARLVAATVDETRARLGGDFADALLLDQRVGSGLRARDLGWRPQRASLSEELANGYRAANVGI